MKTYFALVHKEADSAFGIAFPDLPGCFSASDEEDRIFEQAQQALSLYASDETALPSPRSISELRKDREISKEIAAGAFLLAVPVLTIARKSRYNLMLATGLVEGVDRTAQALGVSRSEFVSETLGARLRSESGAVILKVASTGQSAPESTGKKVSSTASKILASKTATKSEKPVAAPALTQTRSKEVTGKAVASKASKIMANPKASKAAKSVAASALTQKVKKK